MKQIEDLLGELEVKLTNCVDTNFFSRAASAQEIEKFQNTMSVNLTQSLEKFYKKYNGGFIALGDRNHSNLKHPNHFDDAAWVSNQFLSLTDVINTYFQKDGSCGFADFRSFEKLTRKRLVPIMITNTQEYYLWDVNDHDNTILIALTNDDYENENIIYKIETSKYKTFEDLLKDYISTGGLISFD